MSKQNSGVVVDHYSGAQIIYPQTNARLAFDFLFRSSGSIVWRYINSFDTSSELTEKQKAVVERNGGEWCIINPRNNIVVQESRI